MSSPRDPFPVENPLSSTSVGRRGFLAGLAAASSAVAGIGATANASETQPTGGGLASWTVEDFRRLRGDSFVVRSADGDRSTGGDRGRLHLLEAAPRRGTSTRQPFSLLFRAPAKHAVPQDVYQLAHPQLGAFSLLLVPVTPPGGPMLLEAIIG